MLDARAHDLRVAGYDRAVYAAASSPLTGLGLDATAPELYQALVADCLDRMSPKPVGVRELHYENPFFNRLFGQGAAEKTVSTTAQVIETVSTLGSTRKMAQADASVAERTVNDRVEDRRLDVKLKSLAIQREQEALLRDRIANAEALQRLSGGGDRSPRPMIEALVRAGLLDAADSVEALAPGDVQALRGLALLPLELREHSEVDDDERPD